MAVEGIVGTLVFGRQLERRGIYRAHASSLFDSEPIEPGAD